MNSKNRIETDRDSIGSGSPLNRNWVANLWELGRDSIIRGSALLRDLGRDPIGERIASVPRLGTFRSERDSRPSERIRYFQGMPEAVTETEQQGGCAC
ncbi:hypothetical protein OROHE_001799 [Orobanche hederae]